MAIQKIEYKGVTWIDIPQPTVMDIEYLRQNFPFHPLDIEDLLGNLQRPKLDEYDDYLFLVVHMPVFDKARRVTAASEVNLFVGPDYLVSLHKGELWPIAKLFDSVKSSERLQAENLGNGPGYLLYKLIDKLVDNCFPLVYKIERNVQEIETKIFESKVRETVFELSVIRRDIIAFRRIIKPQIPVISRLEYLKSRIINEELEIYFSDISDHLGKIWDSLDDLKTITESLNDTHTSLTSYQTSEVMKVLTTISVIMLPLTLISGIFGMNVRVPGEGTVHAFWLILGLMVFVVVGMVVFFRRRGWL
ncbi:MAG: magnesium transporter CorA family protein [Cyanobacteria bacterium RYN_339]|nr:magnesium transporter CorA family protein [Cyanobacteria bacterium RYN_339]